MERSPSGQQGCRRENLHFSAKPLLCCRKKATFATLRLSIVFAPRPAPRYRLHHRSLRVRNRPRPVVSARPRAQWPPVLLRFHRTRPLHRSVRLPLLFSLLALLSEGVKHVNAGVRSFVSISLACVSAQSS